MRHSIILTRLFIATYVIGIPIHVLPALGQEIDIVQSNVIFDQFTRESGLKNEPITGLEQDSLGFYWIGTRDGLMRFDGYEFLPYEHQPGDSTSLPENRIETVYVDKSQSLWLGTHGGHLVVYNHELNSFSSIYLANYLPNGNEGTLTINAILDKKENGLWIGTSKGLFRKLEDQIQYFPVPGCNDEALTQPENDTQRSACEVLSLAERNDQDLWGISPSGGVFTISFDLDKGMQVRQIVLPDNPINGKISIPLKVYNSSSFGLLVSVVEGPILKYDPVLNTFTTFDLPIWSPGVTVKEIREDTRGWLWMGTSEQGVFALNVTKDKIHHFSHSDSGKSSITNQSIEDIFEDNAGNIWISTWFGLNRYHHAKERFQHYYHRQRDDFTLNRKRVVSIQEKKDNLIVGTYGGGVNLYKRQLLGLVDDTVQLTELHNKIVPTILVDQENNTWVGTINSGIYIFDDAWMPRPQLVESITKAMDPDAKSIINITQDFFGRILIGTFSHGLYVYDLESGEIENLSERQEGNKYLQSNYISEIHQTTDSLYWIGTLGGGLYHLNEEYEVIAHYTQSSDLYSVSSDHIFAIQEDDSGRVWIGTQGGGLNQFISERQEFKQFGIRDGLNDNTITTIEVGLNGDLWLGTSNGLTRFSPNNLEAGNYYVEDGIQDLDFSDGASLRGQDGMLYFGGADGFNIIDTRNDYQQETAFDVLISEFTIRGEERVELGNPALFEQLTLPYGDNYFSIVLSSSNISISDGNHYRYQLVGFEKEWNNRPGGENRFATYRELPAGEYVFRAQTTSVSGNWGGPMYTLPITILPPFYQRSWFISLVLFLVSAGLYAFHAFRLKKDRQIQSTRMQGMQDMEKLRMRIAGQLHDHVSANLSTIGLKAETLAYKDHLTEKEKSRLEEITNLARDSANSIRETSWVVNAGFDQLDKLVAAMEDIGEDMLNGVIDFHFERKTDIASIPISMDFRQNVYYFYREAIHNIIKHSRASEVRVGITNEKEEFVLVIEDNGVGFETARVRESNGMVLLRKRAKDIEGVMLMDTMPGKGTRLALKAQLQPVK